MYPLLPFRSLATDIEHAVGEVADDEGGLGDTRCLDTRAEDILIVGDIVWCRDAVNGIEVAGTISLGCDGGCSLNSLFGGVVELVLARPLEALLHTSVFPEH